MTRPALVVLALLAGCGEGGRACEEPFVLYLDRDLDGYGDPNTASEACVLSDGWVSNAEDCDDRDDNIRPWFDDVCEDGIDSDCDGFDPWCADTIVGSDAVLPVRTSLASAGFAVAGRSDLNGDGLHDVVVGAPGWGGGLGRAYVAAGNLIGTRYIDLEGATLYASFGMGVGTSVATVGDLDNDANPDVVVGAPDSSPVGANEGLVYVAYGPMDAGETYNLDGSDSRYYGPPYGRAGHSVASAGDVDDNGRREFLVGAPGSPGLSVGSVYIVTGSLVGIAPLELNADVLRGTSNTDLAGWSVDGDVDVNADGLADVVVGAPGFAEGRGAAVVALAPFRPEMSILDAEIVLFGLEPGDNFGAAVGGVEDDDDDGYGDVLVAAPMAGPGTVSLYTDLWRGAGVPAPTATLRGEAPDSLLGGSVCGLGDVDDDGASDIGVSWPGYSGASGIGAAVVWRGPHLGTVLAVQAGQVIAGQNVGDAVMSVADAGDVQGDGIADLLVGAVGYDALYLDSGAAFVIRGR